MAKYVLWAIQSFAGYKGSAWPGVKTLATMTQMHDRTVQSCVRHLEGLGLIAVTPQERDNGSSSSNAYTVNVDSLFALCAGGSPPPGRVTHNHQGGGPQPPLEPPTQPPIQNQDTKQREKAGGSRVGGPEEPADLTVADILLRFGVSTKLSALIAACPEVTVEVVREMRQEVIGTATAINRPAVLAHRLMARFNIKKPEGPKPMAPETAGPLSNIAAMRNARFRRRPGEDA